MDAKEKRKSIRIYEKRLDKFGIDVKTVGWRSKHQQNVRFEAVTSIEGLDKLSNKSILDIGCGFGDLYDFLKSKGVKIKKYKGIDLSVRLIEAARKLHEGAKNAKFEVVDILKDDIEEFDYVVASGIFNQKIKDNAGHAKRMLRRMFGICRLGLAVNMITNYVDYKEDKLFYFSPEEVFSFCKQLTKRVCLRHDYMPFEFTVYLYKDQTVDKHNVFKAFSDQMHIIERS